LRNAGGGTVYLGRACDQHSPANLGFEILVRYVTRANERYQQRSKLYYEIVELLRRKNIRSPRSLPRPPLPPPPKPRSHSRRRLTTADTSSDS